MGRDLDPLMQQALESGVIVPAILAELPFVSTTEHVWTGYGPLTWNANTYKGVGSLAGLGAITEGINGAAEGTTISLSGIDPALYSESMDDIQVGSTVNIWWALLSQGAILGQPYLLFSGQMDKPSVNTGPDDITITIALENRLTNLQRPNARRYTLADQRRYYPTCTGFSWVELLNDIALRWGS